jgi:uncharacterized protein
MEFKDIGNPTYIALETFRKNGEGVITPVWAVAEQNKLYVWTVSTSGKIKRIRTNGRVRIAVCDARGTLKSDWVEAQARVLDAPEDVAKQQQRTAAKYGLQFQLISLMGKLRRDNTPRAAVEISPI